MLKRVGSRLTYANLVATGALFVALGGGAYALSGIPDRGGVYHGCVAPKTGALRVVKAASSCRKTKTVRRRNRRSRIPGESAIAWNQNGRPGTNGINGINGTNGKDGTNGINAATNVVVRRTTTTLGGAGFAVSQADCQPGERAVGGGVGRGDGSISGADSIRSSFPTTIGSTAPAAAGVTPTSWRSGFSTGSATDVTFFVVCASP